MSKICTVQDCMTEQRAKSFCKKHLYRFNMYGSPLKLVKPNDFHEGSRLPEYRVWHNMIQRCHNHKSKNYHYYGGRGIYVCEQWKASFRQFFTDMGSRPTNKHTIDRINNNKGYSPSNCRWVTQREQHYNMRPIIATNTSGYKGISWAKARNKWRAYIDTKHLGYFLRLEDAIEARKSAEKHSWEYTIL